MNYSALVSPATQDALRSERLLDQLSRQSALGDDSENPHVLLDRHFRSILGDTNAELTILSY